MKTLSWMNQNVVIIYNDCFCWLTTYVRSTRQKINRIEYPQKPTQEEVLSDVELILKNNE